MIRHIVSWNFKSDVPQDVRDRVSEQLREAFPQLVGKIPGLLRVEVGMPPLPSSNCDLSLYNELEDEAALAAYRDHPEHVELAAVIGKYAEMRRCVDLKAD